MSIFDFKLDVSLPYLCESPKRWTCILNNLHSKIKQFILWQALFVDFFEDGICLSQQIFVFMSDKFLEEAGNKDVLWEVVLHGNCADEFDDFELGEGFLESALGVANGGSGRVGFKQTAETAKHLHQRIARNKYILRTLMQYSDIILINDLHHRWTASGICSHCLCPQKIRQAEFQR